MVEPTRISGGSRSASAASHLFGHVAGQEGEEVGKVGRDGRRTRGGGLDS